MGYYILLLLILVLVHFVQIKTFYRDNDLCLSLKLNEISFNDSVH